MSRRWPFLIPFLFMSTGMVLSALTGYFCDLSAVIAVFSCLLLAVFLPHSALFTACTALFFFAFGLFALNPWLSPETSPHSVRTKASDSPITIEGVISARPSVAPEGSRLTVQVERVIKGERWENASGVLLLYVSEGDVTLTRGDRVRFISRISLPRLLGLPGEFDYSRFSSTVPA